MDQTNILKKCLVVEIVKTPTWGGAIQFAGPASGEVLENPLQDSWESAVTWSKRFLTWLFNNFVAIWRGFPSPNQKFCEFIKERYVSVLGSFVSTSCMLCPDVHSKVTEVPWKRYKNQTKGKSCTDEKHKKSKSERTWSDTELDRGHSSSPSNRLVFHRTFGGTRNSEVGFIYRTRASMCRTAWTGDTDSPSLETLVVPLADKTALWITTHISWVIFNSYMS